MPELDRGNQAHISVFFFLTIERQTDRPFDSVPSRPGAGLQKLSELNYFNSAVSPDMLRQIAALMAHKLIVCVQTYYTQQREAAHADDTLAELIGTISNLMINPDKTVRDLADLADSLFRYKSENSAELPIKALVAGQTVPSAVLKKLQKRGIR